MKRTKLPLQTHYVIIQTPAVPNATTPTCAHQLRLLRGQGQGSHRVRPPLRRPLLPPPSPLLVVVITQVQHHDLWNSPLSAPTPQRSRRRRLRRTRPNSDGGSTSSRGSRGRRFSPNNAKNTVTPTPTVGRKRCTACCSSSRSSR